jgi:hypothetical protein
MTSAGFYPPHTDPYLAGMIKWFCQAPGSSEVQALHGSSVNPSYTRSILYSCTIDVAQRSSENWSQVLLGCCKLLSALNGSHTPRFWHLTGLVDSEQ